MTDAVSHPPEHRYTALVLAGRRGPEDPVARAAGLSHKCLVPVGGAPMLARVVEALAQSRSVARIAISIEQPDALNGIESLAALREAARLAVIPSAASPCLSVQAAADALGRPVPMLITTADHPLLTPDLIDEFAAGAEDSRADVAAGLTPGALLLEAYPQARRTFLGFRDGRYTGCNLIAVLTPAGWTAVDFWRRIENDRKRPWRIARAFGMGALLAYCLGLLTLEAAMRRVSRTLGICARAVIVSKPAAGIDVDTPSDLALVEEIVRRSS